MWLFSVIGVAIGLGMDVLSVGMAVGVRWHGRRQRFRLAWHAGLFQFAMPLIGYALGSQLAGTLSRWATYVAALLVAAVGMKMLFEALRARPGAAVEGLTQAVAKGPRAQADPTRGWSLVVLSLATSVDALVVGFSLGLKEGPAIWQASLLIGVTASLMALIGITVGRRMGRALGRSAEIVGGAVLIALGVVFLWL